jgi:hypothetical protein
MMVVIIVVEDREETDLIEIKACPTLEMVLVDASVLAHVSVHVSVQRHSWPL